MKQPIEEEELRSMRRAVVEHIQNAKDITCTYLIGRGWKYVCMNSGCNWLWVKDMPEGFVGKWARTAVCTDAERALNVEDALQSYLAGQRCSSSDKAVRRSARRALEAALRRYAPRSEHRRNVPVFEWLGPAGVKEVVGFNDSSD